MAAFCPRPPTSPRNCIPAHLISHFRCWNTVSAESEASEAEELHRRVPHLDLADLTGDRHRELGDDVDVAWDLVVRQLAGRECLHGVGVQRGTARSPPDPRA